MLHCCKQKLAILSGNFGLHVSSLCTWVAVSKSLEKNYFMYFVRLALSVLILSLFYPYWPIFILICFGFLNNYVNHPLHSIQWQTRSNVVCVFWYLYKHFTKSIHVPGHWVKSDIVSSLSPPLWHWARLLALFYPYSSLLIHFYLPFHRIFTLVWICCCHF